MDLSFGVQLGSHCNLMMTLTELHRFLLQHLLDDVMPFWARHSIDWQNGGMWTLFGRRWLDP